MAAHRAGGLPEPSPSRRGSVSIVTDHGEGSAHLSLADLRPSVSRAVTLRRYIQQTEPLYVLNGVPLGRSYALADASINPEEVISIKLLDAYDARKEYGELASEGAVVISTWSWFDR